MSFADTVLTLAPLEANLESPLKFHIGGEAPLNGDSFDVLSTLFEVAGLRKPVSVTSVDGLTTLDKIAGQAVATSTLKTEDALTPEQAILSAQQKSALGSGCQHYITANDGTELCALQLVEQRKTDQQSKTPILLLGAPGTPIQLMDKWMQGLSTERSVASWETRGLFGTQYREVSDFSISTQVNDALATAEHFGWQRMHVMGVCGGAMLALAFAATYAERVQSISLWFGDYELGDKAAKTDHQRNLQALMKMVVDGQVSAGVLRDTLLRGFQQLSEPDLAPLALYPYANADLLAQYCRMNYPIMSTDCMPYLHKVRAPSMVVFSPDDSTTHAQGSEVVAQVLGVPLISVASSGHLGTFKAMPTDVTRALDFYRQHDCI